MENPNLKKPLYSIIVLVYHRTQELVDMAKDCIANIKNSSQDYELLLIDNGSTIRYEWEKECDTYVRLNKNWGISHGWNIGAKLARGQYFVFLGDDTIVHKGYLEAMKEGFNNKDCGMCNPHLENLPGGMGIVENYKWPSGACFMITPEVVEKVGYFDEEVFYPANFEDISYWVRLYKAGYKIYTNYHLTIQHLEGQTIHAPDISRFNDDNKKRFVKLHGFDPIPIFFGYGVMPSFK